MNYIYIDLGAYDGDSIRQFMRLTNLPVKPSEFRVFAFEPNPNMSSDLYKLRDQYMNITVVNDAAWIADEIREFAVDTNPRAYGSTLMQSKEDIWQRFSKIQIECVDFSKWIKNFQDDYVIVKMDIEGAEFPILAKMMADGTHKIIRQLWLETHSNKVRDYTTTYSDNLFKELRKDIYVEDWS